MRILLKVIQQVSGSTPFKRDISSLIWALALDGPWMGPGWSRTQPEKLEEVGSWGHSGSLWDFWGTFRPPSGLLP